MKPKILICIDWFEPGYKAGGPIRSIVNLVNRLENFDFYILTSNKDHHSSKAYDLPTLEWVIYNGHTKVFYLSDEHDVKENLRVIMREIDPDMVYLNSLFSKRFALDPLLALRKEHKSTPIVLAPRGMLKSGALSIKPIKKKLFILLSKILGWFKNITWHATNAQEAAEIKQHFGEKSMVKIAPNLSGSCVENTILQKEPGSLKLIMVARVSAEKNVLDAIRFLGALDEGSEINLDLYGTLQDEEYLWQCKKEIRKWPHIAVQVKGEIAPHELDKKWSEYHFSYLTTLGENYGHSIVESFLHGLPVIISDKTPWRNLEPLKAGFDLALDEDSFVPALRRCLAMGFEEYTQWCKGASNMGRSIANDQEALSAAKKLFSTT